MVPQEAQMGTWGTWVRLRWELDLKRPQPGLLLASCPIWTPHLPFEPLKSNPGSPKAPSKPPKASSKPPKDKSNLGDVHMELLR